ncbi:MAG: C25 family cysteine peptidase [Candidatus Cloacimonadota bacterium]|nr:C25 family cysteine peptidase [Candidatus Cloacimonadota bacterium]
MKNSVTFLFALFLILSTVNLLAEIQQEYNFDINRIEFQQEFGYDFITFPDAINLGQVGAPDIPKKIERFVIPQNNKIKSVRIISLISDTLTGKYNIYPAQPPQVLSKDESEINFIPPSKKIYSSKNAYPERIVSLRKNGYLAGYNIASIIISPLQYLPAEKKLIFHSHITLEILFEKSERYRIDFSTRNANSKKMIEEIVAKSVNNPMQIEQCSPEISQSESRLPAEDHLYVIITSDELVADFQPLADWRKRKGFSAKIVSTSFIYANYEGVDDAEKVRNFIIDAYASWGTLWVLLGGDTEVMPFRQAFAFDCEYGSYEDNYLPCDLYFSDLDGSWNANGNDIYGEIADNIDMYPDVFVGRASVENSMEATAFVEKILTYEKNPPANFSTEMLFLAMVLWNDPYTDSSVNKNYIDEMFVPQSFDPIEKLYQSLGNETPENVMNALNAGQNFINHSGHAGWHALSIGNYHNIDREDMDALTNAPAFSNLYSIGCWPAAFDYDCVAEHFLNNPNGGGIAFFGNSRYGWGSPGNPFFGYSDRFDQEFYHQIFDQNIILAGNTLGALKTKFIPLAQAENVYRWCEYEINLLGDPAMPFWTDVLDSMVVICDSSVHLGENYYSVIVQNQDLSPFKNALVCVMQNDGIYQSGFTNFNGQVEFDFEITDPSESVFLTITAPNKFPFESNLEIIVAEPYLDIVSYSTNNSQKGLITPGDTIFMNIEVRNFGAESIGEVESELDTESDKIVILDGQIEIGEVPANTSLIIENAFLFSVSSEMQNGETIFLDYEITGEDQYFKQGSLPVLGATPVLSYFYNEYENENNPEPGESAEIHLLMENSGFAESQNVEIEFTAQIPFIEILEPVTNLENIPAEKFADHILPVSILPNCPTPSFAEIVMNFETETGYTFADTFSIGIGEIGFFDEMESGDENWEHFGENDLWHLSSEQNFSGEYSWYCGDEATLTYVNDMDAKLQTEGIILEKNAELSFWCWYQFPNYGTDGIYAEIYDGTEWIELDFIGSGGALGILPTSNDWIQYVYDLSGFPQGTAISLRFRMHSDESEVEEGAFIDDVKIAGTNRVISANFSADNLYGAEPLVVNFTDKSYSAVDSIASWFWEFEDGSFSYEQNPTHTFDGVGSGKQTIKLTVEDEFGFSSEKIRANYIEVLSLAVDENPFGSTVFHQNYPNPFAAISGTSIRFGIKKKQDVQIDIFNILGQKVKNIVAEELPPGNYSFNWDGKNAMNDQVSVGVYFYRIKTKQNNYVRKMLLMR